MGKFGSLGSWVKYGGNVEEVGECGEVCWGVGRDVGGVGSKGRDGDVIKCGQRCGRVYRVSVESVGK